MQNYFDAMLENLAVLLPNLLTAILILAASLYLAKWLSRLLSNILIRHKADPEVTSLLAQISRWSIIVIGTITALQRFFDITAFLAGLGILGFTVGFALQNIMQNFAAGIILLIQQPFNVGDAIEVTDYGGTVLAINLRTTELRTWDGRIVILPNAEILAEPIVNYTRADRRRIELPVGVSYTADPQAAREAILRALQTLPGVLAEPPPQVVFHTFGSSSLDLTTYFWIDISEIGLFDAQDYALRAIKIELDKNGIEIPFPIRMVYLTNQE